MSRNGSTRVCIALRLATLALAAGSFGCRETAAPAPVAQAQAPAKPAPEPTPASAAAALPDPPIVPEAEPAILERHDPQPSAACLAKTGDAGATRATSIHRWVDAAGVTHYSDQAPATPVSGHRILEVHGLPPIAVEASGYDVNLPSDLEHRAIVDALAVQRVFHDTLGIGGPAAMSLRIVFVGNADAYAQLVGERALAASSGAFVPQQHTIYMRMQLDDEIAFSILRHEITHALVHERVGNLPVSLNEGLAEYFRRYHAAGMGGQIDLSQDRNGLIGAAPKDEGSDALVDLLALTGPDFYAADRDRRYFRAYALIALLMGSADGTAALHDVLARQQVDPCVPVRAETVLDARYPGGLPALARDWAAFLRDPPVSVRAY